MGDRMRRRKQESIAADPTLAEDLLGSPSTGSGASNDTDVIDSTDLPATTRTSDACWRNALRASTCPG